MNDKDHNRINFGMWLSELLRLEFARKNKFDQLSFEQIGEFLAQAKETAVNTEHAAIDACIESYCKLLFCIERMNTAIPAGPISEWQETLAANSNPLMDFLVFLEELEDTPQNLRFTDPITRAKIQTACLIVESSCHARFFQTFENLWATQKNLLRNVVSSGQGKFHFVQPIQDFFEHCIKQTNLWPLVPRFPYTRVLGTLRSLLLMPVLERKYFNLIEISIFAFFLCQNRTINGVQLRNAAKVLNLSEHAALSFFLSLLQLDILREQSLCFDSTLTKEDYSWAEKNMKLIADALETVQFAEDRIQFGPKIAA